MPACKSSKIRPTPTRLAHTWRRAIRSECRSSSCRPASRRACKWYGGVGVRLWEARQNGFTIVGRCGGEDSKPWFERIVLMICCVVRGSAELSSVHQASSQERRIRQGDCGSVCHQASVGAAAGTHIVYFNFSKFVLPMGVISFLHRSISEVIRCPALLMRAARVWSCCWSHCKIW